MRWLVSAALVAAVGAAGCGSSSSTPAPTPSATMMSGTWVGSASDSSGTMMGGGVSASMMGGTTWSITQTGNNFSGTMHVGGHDGGTMVVSGTMTGRTGTFTMTMPAGSMMMSRCSATATGTFDIDDMMQFHGTYAGTNTCTGPFGQGQMTMTHQ
jgi:hypothetical protein